MTIPPMLAQPFIENAIKQKESKGHIQVRFRCENDVIRIEVEDDGIGRKVAQEILQRQDKDHKSLATMITRERIAALNKKSKKKISLEIVDLFNDSGEPSGTKVVFIIPV